MRLTEFEYAEILRRQEAQRQVKTDRSAQAQGYMDFWNQGIGGKNPYPIGSKDAHQWYKGWLQAKEDDTEASR